MAILTSASLGRCAVAALALLLGALAALPVRATPSAEYQLKAVFLFNFAQFVEWPESSFGDGQAPFVIGVLGQDPFGEYLDRLVQGEAVRGRKVEIRRFASVADIDHCQILFVSRDAAIGWKSVSSRLRSRSTLTVSDRTSFTSDDGMILFAHQAGKIRLVVNVAMARASALTISSKLLRSAQVVSGDEG
jgi:hypothetical protein